MHSALADLPGRGWFEAPGIRGDRTLAQQMRGLDALLALCDGASVLDLGCAEGLIGLELVKAGATLLHGVELVPNRVETAQRNAQGTASRFWQGDLEKFAAAPPAGLLGRYDVVLALAIAHKLRTPATFLWAAAGRCAGILAVRLPAQVIRDKRSDLVALDVPKHLKAAGFDLWHENLGSHAEWIGLFRRAER